MHVTDAAEEGTTEEGIEKGVEASSINGDGSAGKDSMKTKLDEGIYNI